MPAWLARILMLVPIAAAARATATSARAPSRHSSVLASGVGWLREVRVPPFRAELDGRPINERYDMRKFFEDGGREVGVAIEMDNWMVHRDLLKFRRGLHRGQIVAGVIIQPNYRETHYCFEHFRHLNESLFGGIPVLYCCPRGPGLEEPPVAARAGSRS